MAKTLQFRRDTTANLASVTGAVGEIFIDTTKDTVVVMDGATAGGTPLATESSLGNYQPLLTAGSGIDITNGTISANIGSLSLNDLSDVTIFDSPPVNNAVLHYDTMLGMWRDGTISLNSLNGVTIDLMNRVNGDALIYDSSDQQFKNTQLKTINGQSLIGSGDLTISGGGGTTYTAGSGIDITNDVISATGAANTGDFTFSGGNISLPDFEDATVNVHGNVTISTSTSSTTTYSEGSGNWDAGRNMVWSDYKLYYSDSSMNSAFGQQLAAEISAGTSITLISAMYGTQTLVTSTAFAFNNGYMRWEATVTESSMMSIMYSSLSFSTSTTVESISEQDFTYTFSQTGEFISDSALVGDVLISDNILTPMPLISDDSYMTETEQPITINGDLEILGNVSGNLTVTGLFVSQQSAEVIANVTATSSGTYGVPLDFNSGAIFYFDTRMSSVSSINFTNIPKVAGQVVTATVVIKQYSSGFMPTTFYIDGTNVTSSIYWSGGSAPTATASTIDILSFSIMWVSGTTYTIFASASNYATV